MRTDDFDFDLPPAFIAQHPIAPRDAARLLRVGSTLGDHVVRDLPDLLRPGDVMVFNDTRVIPARLTGRRGTVRVEVTLHKPEGARDPLGATDGPSSSDGARWRALARPARRLRPGDVIDFAPGFEAEVVERGERGEVLLAFNLGGTALRDALEAHGIMPLPPYIKREDGADPRDRTDYQTVYAAREGAVAAPTAGLHFTPALLSALDERGIQRVSVTLHVGAGTFLPVTAEDPREHVLHSEFGELGAEAAERINSARSTGGRVVAVGTTALRLLESAADESSRLSPFRTETDIFILPGYRFRIVDLLMTNFHLPRSTLFMLVCAFAGTERMKAAYAHAKAAGYRFYSYGDACLLERAEAA